MPINETEYHPYLEIGHAIAADRMNRILEDKNHRYKSWEHSYNAFLKSRSKKLLSLHLSFYLASWGMYRGSSGLLQRDFRIHIGAVNILNRKQYDRLRCSKSNEVSVSDIELILQLKDKLKKYCDSDRFSKEKNKRSGSGTDTLISKIILGTLGCVPAFDRYYIDGARKIGIKCTNFSKSSLSELFGFIDQNKTAIVKIQKFISRKGIYYPLMKIMDMHFWQIGFNKAHNG